MTVGSPPIRLRRETILIVDENRASLQMLGQQLGRLGYSAVLADNGADALRLATGGGFDLALIDCMKPGMDCLHILRELRASHRTADLPVVILTGRSDPQAAVDALVAGADDHVAKPFAFAVLAARVDAILARSARMRELCRANAALDARIAARAVELGEMRGALAASMAERSRLVARIGA